LTKKKFALNHGTSRNDALMDEVKILTALSHPHIIQIFGTFETDQHLYLILELVTGGDLFDKIVEQKCGYSEPRARHIFSQILEAIAYLHSNNIVHRDLKPENILLARKGEDSIKISDFGLSRVIGEGSFMRTLCGTPQYLAPEVLGSESAPTPSQSSTTGYDKSVDLWSLGVILYIILSGVPPFDDRKNLLDQVKNGRYSFPSKCFRNVSEPAIDLIKRLLCVDPSKRITVEEVQKHPWFLDQADNEDDKEMKLNSVHNKQSDQRNDRINTKTTTTTTTTTTTNTNRNIGVKRKRGTPSKNKNKKIKSDPARDSIYSVNGNEGQDTNGTRIKPPIKKPLTKGNVNGHRNHQNGPVVASSSSSSQSSSSSSSSRSIPDQNLRITRSKNRSPTQTRTQKPLLRNNNGTTKNKNGNEKQAIRTR